MVNSFTNKNRLPAIREEAMGNITLRSHERKKNDFNGEVIIL